MLKYLGKIRMEQNDVFEELEIDGSTIQSICNKARKAAKQKGFQLPFANITISIYKINENTCEYDKFIQKISLN